MSRSGENLFTACQKFLKVHHEWAKDDNRQNPDEKYWDAATVLIEEFSTGDIPADARVLSQAVDEFQAEIANYDNRENPDQLYPDGRFWKCVQAIDNIVTDKVQSVPLRPLEPIQELVKLPNMAHEQVARMYGFTDRRGNVMPWLVQKEIDNPGSVLKTENAIDGRTWTDPRIETQAAEKAETDQEVRTLSRKKRAADKEDGPCRESIVDLWEQGVQPAQAARMLKTDEESVKTAYKQLEDGKNRMKLEAAAK